MVLIRTLSFCKYFILSLSSVPWLLRDELGWAGTVIGHRASEPPVIFWMYLFPGKGNAPWTGPEVVLSGIFRFVCLLYPQDCRFYILLHCNTLSSVASVATLTAAILCPTSALSGASVVPPFYYSSCEDRLGWLASETRTLNDSFSPGDLCLWAHFSSSLSHFQVGSNVIFSRKLLW